MTDLINNYQIIYVCAVLGGSAIFLGRKFYKDYKTKQAAKSHRKEWNSKY